MAPDCPRCVPDCPGLSGVGTIVLGVVNAYELYALPCLLRQFLRGSATVNVSCTGLLFLGATYEVRLGGGQSGNINARKMQQASSGHELGYQIYLDNGQVWGNGVQGSTINDFFLLGVFARNRNHSITGTIPANQQVNSGNYSDAVTMTVIW